MPWQLIRTCLCCSKSPIRYCAHFHFHFHFYFTLSLQQVLSAQLAGWHAISENPHNPPSASYINQLKWYPSNLSQYVSKQRPFCSNGGNCSWRQTSKRERHIPFKYLLTLLPPPELSETLTQSHSLVRPHTVTQPSSFGYYSPLLPPCSLYGF